MRKYDRIRKVVRDMLPDIPIVRKYLTTKLENSIKATLIPEEDVVWGELNGKKEILDKYIPTLGKHICKIEDQIEQALKSGVHYQELDEKELSEIRMDMCFCRIAYGFLPGEYKAFRLENKNLDRRKTYVSDQQRRLYRCKMNNILAANLFLDKSRTYKKYEQYYKRDVVSISKLSEFDKFQKFVESHEKFVLKNAIDSLGKGVRLVNINEIKSKKEFFYNCIKKGTHVLEELIVQSKYMSAFNVTSVNTVRAITFNTKKGIVVPYCILRMGREGSFVDNGGNDGIIACINYSSGEIITDGFDEKGNIYRKHPDTGATYIGYQLPEWENLKTMCTEVALHSNKIKMIGWDFAHTENGWVLVEGNESPHIIGQQMILGGMKKEMEELIKEME